MIEKYNKEKSEMEEIFFKEKNNLVEFYKIVIIEYEEKIISFQEELDVKVDEMESEVRGFKELY